MPCSARNSHARWGWERAGRQRPLHNGSDDGAVGLRPNYDANYCGAFVRGPDGYKIEAATYSAK
ncbi:hypothetical protein BWO90_04340 (plasmid) [Sinorhizobium meliloti]|nr:hypothetical protein BWO90_04340 [Sinorhizobium meliloti]